MAQSSLITTTKFKDRPFQILKQLVAALDTSTGHDHDGTDSKSITASVTYGLVGAMAAAGTAASNTVGVAASSSRTDHVHALGTHVHDGATTGGATLGDHTAGYIILAAATLPAGTNCYIGRDNTGDVTINALTGKTVNIAVAGTDVVAVSGSQVTITGNLSVSGSFGISGNWDVAATLTVDELILDTDGVAPAGTNCYAVRDNTGDLTLNCITGKTINLAVAGTDIATLSATVFDLLAGTAIDNAGYIILNAATNPAGTECFISHDNTGDVTVNAKTGKTFNVAVNGTDEVNLGDSAYIFNEASADRDFRVESADLAYALYVDGGKNALVLAGNTDISSVDQVVRIGPIARTATAATNFAFLWVQPAGSVTIPAGVTAVVASVQILDPDITATGTVTDAACLYVGAAPTEGGTGNYSIMTAGAIGMIGDAVDLVIGAGRDVLMRWSTADADNHAFAIGLGASRAMHICEAADIASDWNVAAATNPTLYIHGAATPITEYVAISTDETDSHLNSVGANWKFEIGGTAELTLAANSLNLVDSVLYGSAAAHSADTADGSLYLHSTSHATKGFVCVPNTHLGLVIGSDGSVDRATIVGTNTVSLFNGTAPSGTLANGVTFYSEGGEAKVLDAAGNSTTLSPHTDDGDYVIHSYSAGKNETVTIHVEKLLKALAQTPALAKFVEVAAGHKKKATFV